jgi:hypothetical protein
MIGDPTQLCKTRHQDHLKEAEMARLAAQLPRRRSVVRHALARTCYRLANWLDNSNRYLRPAQSGPADWAGRPSNAYIWLAESVTPPAARDFFTKTRPTDQLILR